MVTITDDQYDDHDDWWGPTWVCQCDAKLFKWFKFCPECGVELQWDISDDDD